MSLRTYGWGDSLWHCAGVLLTEERLDGLIRVNAVYSVATGGKADSFHSRTAQLNHVDVEVRIILKNI